LFSHPAVQAITWWDFTDAGAWMGAPAGLLRKDMTPKPAFARLMQLIHQQWWTDVQLQTDRIGACTTRAFLGDYEITAGAAGMKATGEAHATIPRGSEPDQIKIVLRSPL